MATVTARGTGGNNTGATTLAVVPGSTIASGSMGVLVVALDNAGSGGASAIAPTSVTDSVNNTWTLRQNPIYDPAGASGGVELAFYTAPISTQVTTSNNITLTWQGSTSVTAKAWALWEVTPGAGNQITYGTGAAGTGSGTGTPTVTTSSLSNGHILIGGGGAESASTWTGDSDSTNGTWSSQQATGFGSGNTGMSVTSQYKLVTGSGTQTYNPTLTSVDVILGWIQLTESLLPLNTAGFLQFF